MAGRTPLLDEVHFGRDFRADDQGVAAAIPWARLRKVDASFRSFVPAALIAACASLVELRLVGVACVDDAYLATVASSAAGATLRLVELACCPRLVSLAELARMPGLEDVRVYSCCSLEALGIEGAKAARLERFDVNCCDRLTSIASLSAAPALGRVEVGASRRPVALPVDCPVLREVVLSGPKCCASFSLTSEGWSEGRWDLSTLASCPALESVALRCIESPLDLSPLHGCRALRRLSAQWVHGVETPVDLSLASDLVESLRADTCKRAVFRGGLGGSASWRDALSELVVYDCDWIAAVIPRLEPFPALRRVNIVRCLGADRMGRPPRCPDFQATSPDWSIYDYYLKE